MAMLTINVREANQVNSLPSALEERLNGTPTKSPEELAKAIEACSLRSSKLREAHLENVRERATRDIQRTQEAAKRAIRIAANRAERVQRKLDFNEKHVEAVKEAAEAERAAKSARRAELALSVAEARKALGSAKTLRQEKLLAAEAKAASEHAKAVAAVVSKGRAACEHAKAVAAANKEKAESDAAALGAALAGRLNAAEARRTDTDSSPPSPDKSKASPRFQVLNNDKVDRHAKRIALEGKMAKHDEKRAQHLASVIGKARAVSNRHADVVGKQKLAAAGTDTATAEAKSALYERMVKAEVSRLEALKAKYAKAAEKKGDTTSVIIVHLDDVLTPRAPPAKLLLRLAAKPSALVATAADRQSAAKARRAALAHAVLLKAATAAARRSAALERVRKAASAKAAGIQAKAVRSRMLLALSQGKRAASVAKATARRAFVLLKRKQFDAGIQLVGELHGAKLAAAALVRQAKATAPKGGVAKRKEAFNTRREALDTSRRARGAVMTARCTAAAAKRAALLQARVEKARKLAKAKSSEA